MDPYDSPLESPIVVPITHSPIPYYEPGSYAFIVELSRSKSLMAVANLSLSACVPTCSMCSVCVASNLQIRACVDLLCFGASVRAMIHCGDDRVCELEGFATLFSAKNENHNTLAQLRVGVRGVVVVVVAVAIVEAATVAGAGEASFKKGLL